jgi:DNA repair protein SbcD/Mre11
MRAIPRQKGCMMSETALRYLHAGDFRLDTAMRGLPDIPDHLLELLLDAPRRAAKRVFDTAVREQAACVLLTGELLDPQSPAPGSLAFLRDQFARLAAERIHVFWASATLDPTATWPSAVPLPDNVTHFASDRVDRRVLELPDRPPLLILGRSGPPDRVVPAADFAVAMEDHLTVAVTNGLLDAQQAGSLPVDYWALGGQPQRDTPLREPRIVHRAGSPQAREPHEQGPHGCSVIDVDDRQSQRLRFIECDTVQWRQGRVVVAAAEPRQEIHQAFGQHVDRLQSAAGDKPLLVRWDVFVQHPPADPHLLWELAEHLTTWLRDEFGRNDPPLWSVAVEVTGDDQVAPSWYEEDTLLGHYLRAMQQLETDGSLDGEDPLIGPSDGAGEINDWPNPEEPESRVALVREAACLGARLLRGNG